MISLGSCIALNVVEGSDAMGWSRLVAVSLTSPRPSFLSSRRRFGLGLPYRCSTSYSCVAPSLFTDRSSCGFCMMGWERCDSSSHSMVANSGNRHFADCGGMGLLGCGAGRLRGGNSIVRY